MVLALILHGVTGHGLAVRSQPRAQRMVHGRGGTGSRRRVSRRRPARPARRSAPTPAIPEEDQADGDGGEHLLHASSYGRR